VSINKNVGDKLFFKRRMGAVFFCFKEQEYEKDIFNEKKNIVEDSCPLTPLHSTLVYKRYKRTFFLLQSPQKINRAKKQR